MTETARSRGTATACPEEAVFVDLVRTADLLSRRTAALLRDYDLSTTQYNVLRILRGAPEGLLCGEVATRMITRDPDITRLLGRLEKRELVARAREHQDRRRVLVRITSQGQALLTRIEQPLHEVHRAQLGHLGPHRLQEFAQLLAVCREKVD